MDWLARPDLNREPLAYKALALTIVLRAIVGALRPRVVCAYHQRSEHIADLQRLHGEEVSHVSAGRRGPKEG